VPREKSNDSRNWLISRAVKIGVRRGLSRPLSSRKAQAALLLSSREKEVRVGVLQATSSAMGVLQSWILARNGDDPASHPSNRLNSRSRASNPAFVVSIVVSA